MLPIRSARPSYSGAVSWSNAITCTGSAPPSSRASSSTSWWIAWACAANPSARDALVSTRIVTEAGGAAASGSSTRTRAAASSPAAIATGAPTDVASTTASRSGVQSRSLSVCSTIPPVLPRTWTRTSIRWLRASPRSGSV